MGNTNNWRRDSPAAKKLPKQKEGMSLATQLKVSMFKHVSLTRIENDI